MKNSLKVNDVCAIFGNFNYLRGDFEEQNGVKVFQNSTLKITVNENEKAGDTKLREDEVQNVSGDEVDLTCALSTFCLSDGDYEVYTQYSEWCNESIGAWQPLFPEIVGRNDDIRANCSVSPFFALFNKQNGRGYVFHILSDGKWQYSVRRKYTQGYGGKCEIVVEIGYAERDFCYKLQSGEKLKLPSILYYRFTNKMDLDAYKMHRFANAEYPSKGVPIIYNSWMSSFDGISYDTCLEQLGKAKKLGADYFVIDAGWFGPPKDWYLSVGDWEECLNANMRGRMRDFVTKVEEYGLKFGLWFEIERASKDSKNFLAHPEFYEVEDGSAFVDFSNPKAVEFIYGILKERIEKYSIKFIKFDYNAEHFYDLGKNGFIKHFRGYREFLKKIKTDFPDLYLENCASGGMRMALVNLVDFDSFWMSDNHSIFTQARIFKDTLKRIPPRALEKWITLATAKNFRADYVTRTRQDRLTVCLDAEWGAMTTVKHGFLQCASVGGPIGISCDLTEISESDFDKLREFISSYKQQEAFWKDCECRILTDGEGVTVLQFNDEQFTKIKIYAFNYKRNQKDITVYPVCNENAKYTVLGNTCAGKRLIDDGIRLNMCGIDDAFCVEVEKQ